MTLDAVPFVRGDLAFRSSEKDECYIGEPNTLAKDLWMLGVDKILAIPAVNVASYYDAAREAKGERGYVQKVVSQMQYNTDDEVVVSNTTS